VASLLKHSTVLSSLRILLWSQGLLHKSAPLVLVLRFSFQRIFAVAKASAQVRAVIETTQIIRLLIF